MADLAKMKEQLMADGALGMFADNLPNVTGAHAQEAARRYAKMVYTAICQSEDLQKCSIQSIVKASSIAASLDLDIDPRGLAYLIPYGTEATFQIGYTGLIELAYRSGKVKAISANCIYESEKDSVKISRIDGQFSVDHPFSYEAPTGDMIAVYASADITGMGVYTKVMRKSEVERLRNVSKCPNSPAWKNHYEAMAKKTAIRQLAKFLPKSILEDFSKGAALDERETFVEAKAKAEKQIKLQSGSQTIDANFEDQQKKEPEPKAQADESTGDDFKNYKP
jgi:recombination protein RecT